MLIAFSGCDNKDETPAESAESMINDNLTNAENSDTVNEVTSEPQKFNDTKDIFNSKNLRKVIEYILGKEENLTVEDFESITHLNLSGMDIDDITGIEYFTKLESIDLSDNQINDISALRNLDLLEIINLSNNEIEDVSLLNKLVNVKERDLSQNLIVNISVLSNMDDMQSLDISDNLIEDIQVLSKLDALYTFVIVCYLFRINECCGYR